MKVFRTARLLIGAALTIVVGSAAMLSGSPASAAPMGVHADMMCYGRDRLYISTPSMFEDGYVDAAFPEVYLNYGQGWQPFVWGPTIYNDDVPASTSGSTIGGPHTYPYTIWRDFASHEQFGHWDYYVPKGTYVSVKMWFYDGFTRKWYSSWATNVGDIGGHGTVCQAGQYAGYQSQ